MKLATTVRMFVSLVCGAGHRAEPIVRQGGRRPPQVLPGADPKISAQADDREPPPGDADGMNNTTTQNSSALAFRRRAVLYIPLVSAILIVAGFLLDPAIGGSGRELAGEYA